MDKIGRQPESRKKSAFLKQETVFIDQIIVLLDTKMNLTIESWICMPEEIEE